MTNERASEVISKALGLQVNIDVVFPVPQDSSFAFFLCGGYDGERRRLKFVINQCRKTESVVRV